MQIAAFYTVAFSCRIAALSLATQCMPLCYLRCSQALPNAVRKPSSAQQVCPTPLHKSGSAATANFCTVQTAGFERSKQGINKQKPKPTHCVATREALCCYQRGRAVQLHGSLYNGGPPILEAHTCVHEQTATTAPLAPNAWAAPLAGEAGPHTMLGPHEATATPAPLAGAARSNRYYRTKQSLLPHEAIATTARSNRYYRTKQSLLPPRSNRYYRTKQSLLPHEAIATTARSNRYYRTKQSLLPHGATATTAPLAGAAQSNRYYRTKQSLLPHPSQGPHGATATTARSNRYYRTDKLYLQTYVSRGTVWAWVCYALWSCRLPVVHCRCLPMCRVCHRA